MHILLCKKKGEKIPAEAPIDDGVVRSLPKRGNACPTEINHKRDDTRLLN